MKKRILAMVLGCAMAATVLAGCGGQSTDQEKTHLQQKSQQMEKCTK